MGTTLQQQLERNAELISEFVKAGDDVGTPRLVDHVLVVPRRRADAVCADLESLGYRLADRSGGLFRVSLRFEREDAIDVGSAEAFVRQIIGVADQHAADYDGWGALMPSTGEAEVEPADAMDAERVDAKRERDRLREEFAARLTSDGCPDQLAGRLASDLELWVHDDAWGVAAHGAGASLSGRYSPSMATSEVGDLVDELISDNARRRRPRWTSVG